MVLCYNTILAISSFIEKKNVFGTRKVFDNPKLKSCYKLFLQSKSFALKS